ncbi:hypothetical protein, partial [Microbacterium sp. O]
APPPPAQAHDPGQGTAYGTAQMTVTGDGTGQLTVTITGIRLTDDTDLTPSRLVARRTGEDLTAPLRAQPGTPPPGTFTGELALPSPGLWFVYAQFATGERTLEVWVPVDQQLTGPQSQQRNLYQPVTALTPSPGQIILGAVLLAVSTALTVAAAVTVARRRRVLPPATT